jgi:sensor histidine kinase YesM
MRLNIHMSRKVLDDSYVTSVKYYDLRHHLKNYGFTVAMCCVIALFLWLLGSNSFLSNLSFSLFIGLSVHTISVLFMYRFGVERFGLIYGASVPLGVLIGYPLGAIVNGIPMSDIVSDISSTLVSLGIISSIASYFAYSYYTLMATREKLRQEELRSLKNEKAMVETQLRLLQSQIEPHFLFNTLSHVISLMSVDASRAEHMLLALTKFLRATLKRSRNESNRLSDEVRLLEDYLSILKIRMGERLEYVIDVQVNADKIRLPALLIQPLVENAIVHGIESREAGGEVKISLFQDETDLVICVTDNGDGLGSGPAPGQGIGISNVKERLRILYGPDVRLELADSLPHGLTVTIRIPLREVSNV